MDSREWALQHVGDGYIYGAKGQKCSLSFRQQQARQYPDQADMILNAGSKWDGKQVWDCAQFTRAALKNDGVDLVSGATSQWNSDAWQVKGTIGNIPNDICCVFRQSGSKMQHTGLFIGNNTVIHAKGTKYGVIRDNLDSYPWTHWALPKTKNK